MSLQERTLVIKNFDPEKTTVDLLKELCMQTGPIKKVVLRPDHAFIEYEDVESVGYSAAMLGGVQLFGRPLVVEPKLWQERYFKYTNSLNEYIAYDKGEKIKQEMKRMQENQVKILTIPPPPQIFLMPQQQQQQPVPLPAPQSVPSPLQLPQLQHVPQRQAYNQNYMMLPQAPPMQQNPLQMPPQYQQQPMFQTYQAPPDVVRFQYVQTSPYVANPLRPAPEGRAYMPWLHEQPTMNRTQSFHNVTQNAYQQQQQQRQQQHRRLSDRQMNFTQRRR